MTDQGLIGYWPLTTDCEDHAGSGLMTENIGVIFTPKGGVFDGQNAFLRVAPHPTLQIGTDDFSIAAWIETDEINSDVVGDLLSCFDPATRTGWQLTIATNGGMTSTTQPNRRHLQFGIDAGVLEPGWTDCGRPGHAVMIASLLSHNGHLYASTLETGINERGRLWRYEEGGQWTDQGNPVGCNLVHTLASFDGQLYCGVGRYNCTGSALGETLNQTPGGMVYRVNSETGEWIFCGHPGIEDATPEDAVVEGYASGKADDAMALTVFGGRLYCTSNHRRGAFVYEGGEQWEYVGPDERIISFVVYGQALYALINGGPVYRYEGGKNWTFCGGPVGSSQTYSAVVHDGRMLIGTWPEGEVFVYRGGEVWENLGRVGFEREIMAMAQYNGKAYIGTLPMANVWRLDGRDFTFLDTLDQAAAPLRRVWSMAVHQGRLYAGTLPSGRVKSIEAGKVTSWDHIFPGGRHHIAAVKSDNLLRLYVDGQEVATSTSFNPQIFDLSNNRPLHIGFGSHDYFSGLLSEVRLYNRALGTEELTIHP